MTNGDYVRQMDDETLARFLQYAENGYPAFYMMKNFGKYMEKFPDEFTDERLEVPREWVKEELRL